MFSNLGVLKLDLELKTVAEISDEAYYLNFHFFFASGKTSCVSEC